MNPGLVVKLRPSGPWRIGPDSGARNRVDFIYHSDSLYSAVASAMARLGSLDAWLDATARRGEGTPAPEVCFSSCFPFLDEIGFVVPPRTVWPPVSRALVSARVRWKSARFVPLGVVQAVLEGKRLDENHWSVDGASECLVPAGRPGPFRTAVRWSAAVDRLTGSTERHSTACIEFRPGAGLWTIVSFAGEAAHTRWLEPVKAAFRLLADTGFGGERSRGWGRAESPEFIDGILPDMILPPMAKPVEEPEAPVGQVTDLPTEEATPSVSTEPAAEPAPEEQPEQPAATAGVPAEGAPPGGVGESESATAESVAPSTEPPAPSAPVTEPPAESWPLDVSPESPPAESWPLDVPTESPAVEEPPTEPSEPTEGTASVRAPDEREPLAAETSPLPPSEPEPPASAPSSPVLDASPSSGEPIPPIADPDPENPEPAAKEPELPMSAAPEPESAPEMPQEQAVVEAEPLSTSEPASEVEPSQAPAPSPQPPTPALEAPAPGPWPPAPEVEAPAPSPQPPTPALEAPAPGPWPPAPEVEAPTPSPQPPTPALEAPAPGPWPPAPAVEAPTPSPQLPTPAFEPSPTPAFAAPVSPHWLLSLFTPAPTDAVDWRRGNYSVLARGGRVDSPAGSGELKKQVQMIAEGSVVYAPTGPCGAAADVAPDGFAHPVFRAGFAVSIPLPEVS